MGGGNDYNDYRQDQGKAVATQAGQLQQRADTRYDTLYNQFSDREKAANTASTTDRSNLSGLLTGMYNQYAPGTALAGGSGSSGGEAPESGDGSSGGGGSSAPPSSPFDAVNSGFQNFAETGGVDMGALTEALGYFRPLASTGGVSPEQQAMFDSISKQYGDLAKNPFDASGIQSSITGLQNAALTGGYDQDRLDRTTSDINNLRNFSSMDPAEEASLRSQISNVANFQPSQGYSDADIAGVRSGISSMADYGNTGGLSQADQDRYRGTGYTDFANTGGLSASDIANIRARSTSGVPALYSNLSDDMARRASLQGGYTPGYSASSAAMSRDSARQLSDAQRNAEIGIADQVRQGKQFGIAGQAQQEASLQDLLSKNKQFGMSGATSAGLSLSDMLSQQASRNDNTRLSAMQSGVNLGTGLDFGLADRKLQATTAAAQGEGQLAADLANNRITAGNDAASQGINLAQTTNQAQLAALTGQSQQGLNLLSTTNQAKLGGAQGIETTNKDAQGLSQQGKQFGLQGMYNVAGQQQAAAEAAANRSAASSAAGAANDLALANFNATQQRFALSGLQSLYSSSSGELNSADNALLKQMQQQDSTNLGYMGAMIPPAQQQQGQSWWQTALGGLSAAAPLLGGLGGGSGNSGIGGGYDQDFTNNGYQFGGSGDFVPYDPTSGAGTKIPNPSF